MAAVRTKQVYRGGVADPSGLGTKTGLDKMEQELQHTRESGRLDAETSGTKGIAYNDFLWTWALFSEGRCGGHWALEHDAVSDPTPHFS
jgi:hypothetical protein